MRTAFTIVELLVVITIIVVLLSLLAPALDQAVYQAELAVCAGSLRAVGAGVVSYASSHQRFYPRHGTGEYVSFMLGFGGVVGSDGPYPRLASDFRPALRRFITINSTLNDPLARSLNLDMGASPNPQGLRGIVLNGSYPLWFGYRYTGEKAMNKIGDRWTYYDDLNGAVERFGLLASDAAWTAADAAVASHPDAQLRMRPRFSDAEQNDSATYNGFAYAYSDWIGSGLANDPRLGLSMNYAYDDGSVTRENDVAVDRRDERLTSVAYYSDKSSNATHRFILPRR